jgi:dsDNA-specific endonuclease/ATPase MutS2
VALKTVELLALMAQSGLHAPVYDEEANWPFSPYPGRHRWRQSIEQSLSPFTAI